MKFKNQYTQLISALLFTFTLFLIERVYFYFIYENAFSNLETSEVLASFFMGFRVDIAVIFTFIGLIAWFLTMPLQIAQNVKVRKSLGIVWGIIIGGILLFNFGDILYFQFVQRHLNNELALMGTDMMLLVDMGINFYLLETIVGVLFFIGITSSFYYIFSRELLSTVKASKKTWIATFMIFVALFLGIRGKVDGISFGVSDAFAVNKISSGNLALNGFFCYYRGGTASKINHSTLPHKKAIEVVKNAKKSLHVRYDYPEFPMMQTYTQHDLKKYNVVIIMVESFSEEYFDFTAKNEYGVTPNLDKLAANSLVFSDFYANGQRSIEGLTSIYTSLTQPMGFESLGEGLELYGLSMLGDIFKNNGYKTIAMQSSDRGSFKVDQISMIAGFEEYYGAEDIPKVGSEINTPYYGVWDGDMLDYLFEKIDSAPKPFLSFSFTASTHATYYSPGKEWEKYDHDNKGKKGFLNTLNYLDDQVGEFMDKASKTSWYDDTIFIITADHCLDQDLKANRKKRTTDRDSKLAKYHIPLIIHAPKLFKPEVIDAMGSQADIVPSLVDILGFNTPIATTAQSLFDTSVDKRYILTKEGPVISLATQHSIVSYNFKKFLDEYNVTKEDKQLLLGVDNATARLLKKSKWMKQ